MVHDGASAHVLLLQALTRGVHLLRGWKGASVDRQVIWRQIVLFNISQLLRVTIDSVCRLSCLAVILVLIFSIATFMLELRVGLVVIVILLVLGVIVPTILLAHVVSNVTISISDLLFGNLVNILLQILRAIERHILLEVTRVSIAIVLLAIDGHARLLAVVHLLWHVHVLLRIELLRLLHHILLVRLHLRIDYLLALRGRQQVTVRVDQVGELLQVLVDRILIHLLAELVQIVLARVILEDSEVDLFEATQRVHGTALSLRVLEEVFSARIHPLVRILSWASTTAAARGRVTQLAVGTLRMLLLHMSVKGWVG